ncbi:glycine cleavage system H protein [Anaerolinea thermolimosa]|uniref:glycine cleavage system protein GcvH n=1 Tax=Anaerolinea thermolimosa TaxID=229919 RepID=UPI0007864AE7|nr:glycine cleavage system protein GcvH [Anaerolinea thermolimosa]GAP06722.1 glycine cleavage system H protein [Anaerolinea thermolimosa]
MNTPADLRYTRTDEWVKVEGNIATIGVTDYAQDALSDVVFFEAVVSVGDEIRAGDHIATLESVKAAAEVNSPVTGKVVAINENLASSPELVNSDPYGAAWMLKVELSDPSETAKLLAPEEYDQYCQTRSH